MSIVKYRVVWIEFDVYGIRKVKKERIDQGILAQYDNIEDAKDYLHKYCRCTILPFNRSLVNYVKYQIERHIISDEDGRTIIGSEVIEVAKWWDE